MDAKERAIEAADAERFRVWYALTAAQQTPAREVALQSMGAAIAAYEAYMAEAERVGEGE